LYPLPGFALQIRGRGLYYEIKYTSSQLVIGTSTIFLHTAIEKAVRGEKITIQDILPAFPRNGKIERGFAKIGKKVFPIDSEFFRRGISIKVPYVDGLARVYFSEDESRDAWSIEWLDSVPDDMIIEEIFKIEFAKELGDVKHVELSYTGGAYKAVYDRAIIEVVTHSDKITRLIMTIGGKKYKITGDDEARIVLSLKRLKEVITFLELV